MNNLALIRLPSITFSSEIIYGKTIYHGIYEFTEQISQRLRAHLSASAVECSVVRRSYKPSGSAFNVSSPSGVYFVTVCPQNEVLPGAEISICADPRRDAARSWSWFEPLFRRAVEAEFPQSIKWMTIDQYVESEPSS